MSFQFDSASYEKYKKDIASGKTPRQIFLEERYRLMQQGLKLKEAEKKAAEKIGTFETLREREKLKMGEIKPEEMTKEEKEIFAKFVQEKLAGTTFKDIKIERTLTGLNIKIEGIGGEETREIKPQPILTSLPQPSKQEIQPIVPMHRTITYQEMQPKKIDWEQRLQERLSTVEQLPVVNLMAQYRKESEAWKGQPASVPKFIGQVGGVLAGAIEGMAKLPAIVYTMAEHAITDPGDFFKTLKQGVQNVQPAVKSAVSYYKERPEELGAQVVGSAVLIGITYGTGKLVEKMPKITITEKEGKLILGVRPRIEGTIEQLKYTEISGTSIGIQEGFKQESLSITEKSIGYGISKPISENIIKSEVGEISKNFYFSGKSKSIFLNQEKTIISQTTTGRIIQVKEIEYIPSARFYGGYGLFPQKIIHTQEIPVISKMFLKQIGEPIFTELGKGYYKLTYQYEVKGLTITPEGFVAPKGYVTSIIISKGMAYGGKGLLVQTPTVFTSVGGSAFSEVLAPAWAKASEVLSTSMFSQLSNVLSSSRFSEKVEKGKEQKTLETSLSLNLSSLNLNLRQFQSNFQRQNQMQTQIQSQTQVQAQVQTQSQSLSQIFVTTHTPYIYTHTPLKPKEFSLPLPSFRFEFKQRLQTKSFYKPPKLKPFTLYKPSFYAMSFNLRMENPNKIIREVFRPLTRRRK